MSWHTNKGDTFLIPKDEITNLVFMLNFYFYFEPNIKEMDTALEYKISRWMHNIINIEIVMITWWLGGVLSEQSHWNDSLGDLFSLLNVGQTS